MSLRLTVLAPFTGLVLFQVACLVMATEPLTVNNCVTDAQCVDYFGCNLQAGKCHHECLGDSECAFNAVCDWDREVCEKECVDSECGRYRCSQV